MSFSTPHARPEHHHRARQKEARRSLPVVPAPNRSRKACAFLRCTMSRKAPQMPQALPAPARGLRLAGKLPPSPPQKAWVRATPTRPRSPDTDGIPRTPPPLPPGEHPKAPATPAKAVARAPPDPLRLPRTTARSSYPHHCHYNHHHRSPSAASFLRLRCPYREPREDLSVLNPDGNLYNQKSN